MKKFDELLEVTNIESLTKGIKSTKNVGREGYDLIKKAAEQLEPARKFYFIAKGELDSVAAAMESKKNIRKYENRYNARRLFWTCFKHS